MKKENDGYISVHMLCLFEILHKKVKKEIGPKKKKKKPSWKIMLMQAE